MRTKIDYTKLTDLVSVSMAYNKKRITIPGLKIGEHLAVNPRLNLPYDDDHSLSLDRCVVTHLPTGGTVGRMSFTTVESAQSFGNLLLELIDPKILELENEDEARKAFPLWLQDGLENSED